MITDIINQARQLVERGDYTRTSLSVAAGLHANTLRDLNSDSFAPNYNTLLALETLFERLANEAESSSS